MEALVLYCRAGFETDAAAEAAEAARARGDAVRVSLGQGYAVLEVEARGGAGSVSAPGPRDLIFSRQVFRATERLPLASAPDRVAALCEGAWRQARRLGLRGYSELFVEAPDSEGGRRLWPLCAALSGELRAALEGRGLLGPRSPGPRLHVFLSEDSTVLLGTSPAGGVSPWPMGIPRLRFPAGAPSRSALKLEEALLAFVPEGERQARLRPGMRAVDLGASPGGWAWVLAARGIRVTAVDSGPLDRAVLETGLVDHVRADGFTWRPPRPVDWLVCDMVTAPARVAKLVGLWASRGLCREAVFNLKLPSASRLGEVRRCAAVVVRELGRAGRGHVLRFKHLYHDRQEVTGHLRVEPAPRPGGGEKAQPARARRPQEERHGRARRGERRRPVPRDGRQ
ncbi:MAG: 23S rRNA (cytidine(2498)-2'-O)-methyltransferase RlmM [Deferrisomatales bacterium]|nr:23S rRNA (cytidine(2498)-2'-O)-methyltransferase RlmM [Deferrisomatales bacterium]